MAWKYYKDWQVLYRENSSLPMNEAVRQYNVELSQWQNIESLNNRAKGVANGGPNRAKFLKDEDGNIIRTEDGSPIIIDN